MNLSDIYNDRLDVLFDAKNRINTRITEREIEILKDPKTEPLLIEWIKHHLHAILVYIPNIKDRTFYMGNDDYDKTEIYVDDDFVEDIFLNERHSDFIIKQLKDDNLYEICPVTIILAKGYRTYLTDDFYIEHRYKFLAEILERLLITHRKEIWEYYKTLKDYEETDNDEDEDEDELIDDDETEDLF